MITRMTIALLISASLVEGQRPAAQSAASTSAADTVAIDSTVSAPTRAAGPRLDLAAVAMRNASHGETMTQRGQPVSVGKPMALMIVGGAAILLGAFIGDDVGTLFMIGGAGSILVGLYQYLK